MLWTVNWDFYCFYLFFCRAKHPQKLLSGPLIKANTHPQFRWHNKRISVPVQVGLMSSWDCFWYLAAQLSPLYLDYKRKKGSMIGDKSLNFYSYSCWIINWNSRGGYKMLGAEKDSVMSGLGFAACHQKEKRRGQIKSEMPWITWINPRPCALECAHEALMFCSAECTFSFDQPAL